LPDYHAVIFLVNMFYMNLLLQLLLRSV